MATGHINIHFKSKNNPNINYVSSYEFNDDDKELAIIPVLFKDALNLWCHDELESFVEISIKDLWIRLEQMCATHVVPPHLVNKITNAIKYIERYKDVYAGISVIV
jgi:hypothetical protein